MPFLYAWLCSVAIGITLIDKIYYQYKYWYVQGAAMGVIVLIAYGIFGCGTGSAAKKKAKIAGGKTNTSN